MKRAAWRATSAHDFVESLMIVERREFPAASGACIFCKTRSSGKARGENMFPRGAEKNSLLVESRFRNYQRSTTSSTSSILSVRVCWSQCLLIRKDTVTQE